MSATNDNGRAITGILSTISRGRRPQRIFALIYGVDGCGKSTFCSNAPRPIFVGAEKGTEQLDVARFPQTETFAELIDQLRALQNEKHEFQTVVLDSLDWIEPLVWKSVCDEAKVESIEQVDRRGTGQIRGKVKEYKDGIGMPGARSLSSDPGEGADSKQTGRILDHESFRQYKARQAPGEKLKGSR